MAIAILIEIEIMRALIRGSELFFDVDGASIAIDQMGNLQQKSVAFLLHGGPGADHSAYKPSFNPLTQILQLVYIDHRGQGRSARGPQDTYTLENNIEDTEALRQYLGLEKIVLIGSSYGGMVALSYAARYPENVESLIVIATAASYRFLERAKQYLEQYGTSEQQQIAQYLWEGKFAKEEQLKDYFEVMMPLYSKSCQVNPSKNNTNNTIFSIEAINEAFGGFLRTYNIAGDLNKITSPTLVLAGRYDWICPVEFSQEIAKSIANAKLTIFENSGHLIRLDEPKLLIEEIIAFLNANK